MADTMKRLALAAIGTLLPKQDVFDKHVRHMARGVTFLVCGGMIIAALFLATLAGIYMAMLEQGLSVAVAAAITGTVALLGAIVCFLLADRALNRASHLTEELKVTAPPLPKINANIDLQEGATVLFNAFMDGFHTPRNTQEDLFDYAEALRAEVKALRRELDAKSAVNVERQYDEDKDIIRFRPRNNEAG